MKQFNKSVGYLSGSPLFEVWIDNDLDAEDEGTPHRGLQIAPKRSVSRVLGIIILARYRMVGSS